MPDATTDDNSCRQPACSAAAASLPARSYARILGANDRVRVGVVGFSDRCRGSLIPSFQKHAAALNFELVAVSDIWSVRREAGAAAAAEAGTTAPITCRNNDELYARKDVDAVIVATADFQHALHGVEAVRAGRDAYVEKPMANTMEDARALRKAVNDTGKIVQIGTQRRSTKSYQQAYDYLKSGKFGDIVAVEMTWNVNQPGRWRRPGLVGKLREAGHRLEAVPAEPSEGSLRPAQVPRIPSVLAVLVGHPRPVAGAPDRHGALVHRLPAPAQRGRQRRHLPVEGRPPQLGHLHRRCTTTARSTMPARASR